MSYRICKYKKFIRLIQGINVTEEANNTGLNIIYILKPKLSFCKKRWLPFSTKEENSLFCLDMEINLANFEACNILCLIRTYIWYHIYTCRSFLVFTINSHLTAQVSNKLQQFWSFAWMVHGCFLAILQSVKSKESQQHAVCQQADQYHGYSSRNHFLRQKAFLVSF